MNIHSSSFFFDLPVYDVTTGEATGRARLNEHVFGESPRTDIIHRVVRWQMAKRFGTTKKTLGRSDVSRTGKKMHKQKGTGRARHSSAKAPQFRGGGRAFGGVAVRTEIDLPKKVRSLGLRHALSSKAQEGDLVLVHDLSISNYKTRVGKEALRRLGLEGKRCLIVFGDQIDLNFALATRNIPDVDLISAGGLNVYDILNHERLLLSREAAERLDQRFTGNTDWPSHPNGFPGSISVSKVPRKGIGREQQNKPIRPSATPESRKEKNSSAGGGNKFSAQVLLDLASKDISTRREAMKKLVASPSKFNKSDLKARLLPVLLSHDSLEAKEAAVTLAKLAYPEHYPKLIALAVDHDEKYLDRVRTDVEQVLRDEGVLCFTYAETVRRTGNEVVIELRLSSELAFELDGKPARVENLAWTKREPKFNVIVTGAEGTELDWSKDKGSNHAKAFVTCSVAKKGVTKLFFDFFADNRWISRQEILV